jgi:hypothetical protein
MVRICSTYQRGDATGAEQGRLVVGDNTQRNVREQLTEPALSTECPQERPIRQFRPPVATTFSVRFPASAP